MRSSDPPRRVFIERGGMLLFRGDISHAGTENLTNRSHYYVHLHCLLEGVEILPNKPTTIEFSKGPNFDTMTSKVNAGTMT